MHLRRKYQQDSQQYQQSSEQYHPNQKQYQPKVEPSFDWNKLSFPKELRDLAAERKVLQKKITEIENRLRFGYSEPLHDYKMQLVKQDIELSCKMTDQLLVLSSKH